jgi:hypothetical protein
MSSQKVAIIIVTCIIIGVTWGLVSVFSLGNHFVASQDPADYPPNWDSIRDLYPPGDYSTFGKSVFFPGWASAQLTTIDGIIYYAGPNTDMHNPLLYLCSIGIGTIVILLVIFIPSVA